ncbi:MULTISPECIES: short-chain fatty acyl-CoA regulator family protein [Corynebacterium]|uniref:helix-turn-helix domain-containing protein n=1 Tax=Corynebacterium TaxID=1716 RepID=UPI00124F3125|nr:MULTISPECIES: short-chain fatty acyl-CoA regulator family protein [Corynebacterium]
MDKLFAGVRIRALRSARHLTQAQMARLLGISTSYLNQLENDKRPLTAPLLISLAQHFSVGVDYFSTDSAYRHIDGLKERIAHAPDIAVSDNELYEIATHHPEFTTALLRTPRDEDDSASNPYETVRDLFYAHHNHFPAIEEEAESLAASLGSGSLRSMNLAKRLAEDAGISVRFNHHHVGPKRQLSAHRELHLRSDLSAAQLCFEMALQYGLVVLDPLFGRIAATLPESTRDVARLGLAQYFASAVTLPYGEFLAQAEQLNYDIEALGVRFGTSFEATCHRLSTLQRPGAHGVPFFFIRTDRAGNISKRQSATSFHFSHSGGSCPLWVIHRAFDTPETIVRQVAAMPDGRTYLWIARTITRRATSFSHHPAQFAIGLGCDITHADRLVYSHGLNLSPDAATPIGPGCRSCSRSECNQRAFPYARSRVEIDLSQSARFPYA